MRIVFKADRIICGAGVPEFFVTHIGNIMTLGPSTAAITFCQNDVDGLLPVARLIWPIERLLEVNPGIGRRCIQLPRMT